MRFLVADDHMLIRQALSALPKSMDGHATEYEANGFDEAFAVLAAEHLGTATNEID